MTNPVTIKFTPDLKVLEKASIYIFTRVSQLRFLPILFIAVCAMNYFMPGNKARAQESNVVGEQYVTITCVVVFWIALYFIVRRGIRKSLQRDPKNHEAQQMTFTPEYVAVSGETYAVTHNWKQIKSVRETKEWILLFLNASGAMVVPKEKISASEYNLIKDVIRIAPVKQNLK